MIDLSPAVWCKSSHSAPQGNNCVEVAGNLPGVVAIRDSKNPHGGVHTVTPAAFRALLAHVTRS